MRLLDKQPNVPLTLSAKIMVSAFPEPPSLFQQRAIVQVPHLQDPFVRLKPSLALQIHAKITPSVPTLESTLCLVRVVAQGTRVIIAKLPRKVIVVPPATHVLQLPSALLVMWQVIQPAANATLATLEKPVILILCS